MKFDRSKQRSFFLVLMHWYHYFPFLRFGLFLMVQWLLSFLDWSLVSFLVKILIQKRNKNMFKFRFQRHKNNWSIIVSISKWNIFLWFIIKQGEYSSMITFCIDYLRCFFFFLSRRPPNEQWQRRVIMSSNKNWCFRIKEYFSN
jgi:hypothetical protein